MDMNDAIGKSAYGRRQILGVAGAAALAVGASQFGFIPKAEAQPGTARAAARTGTSFGPLRQIDAGVLNVGYVDAGPADGTPVILMHGFPYDIHSYVEGAPLLAAAGYRLMQAILYDRVQIAKAVNATPITLDEAPRGYAEFDAGAATKYVLDPNGYLTI